MSQYISAAAQAKMRKIHQLTAKAYGGNVGEKFAATPSVAQTLNEKIVQDGNWFLQLINTVPVTEMKGEKVSLGLSGRVTGRTDTSGAGERVAKNLISTDGLPYTLEKTDSDVALKYNSVDSWAKFSNFRALYAIAVRQAIGNDRLQVGFNGTSAAADSVAANLSDVNIGWLEQIRTYNGGSQYVLGSAGSVLIGVGGVFPNLDSLVHDAIARIEIQHRRDPDRVVLVGENVMQYAKGLFYDANGNKPTEKQVIESRVTVETYGGLPAYVPPFMDPDTILVTSLKNLSVYWQDSSWRRHQIDNPKKDQYEDFNSRNEGFVVEHLGKTSLIQGIEYV